MAAKLAPVVADLRDTGAWPRMEVPAALLLFDVLGALGFPPEEQEQVLGTDATMYLNVLVGLLAEEVAP